MARECSRQCHCRCRTGSRLPRRSRPRLRCCRRKSVRDCAGCLCARIRDCLFSYAIVSSGVFVLPKQNCTCTTKSATTVASRSGANVARPFVPPVLKTPAVSRLSLIVIGTPWSGPESSSCARAASALRASASAASDVRLTTAFKRRFTASLEGKAIRLHGRNSLLRIARPSSPAEYAVRSIIVCACLPGRRHSSTTNFQLTLDAILRVRRHC